MSAAHTCFRSALTQAFRPNSRGIAAPCSVSAFLVPALGKHHSNRRLFTSGKRRLEETQSTRDISNERTKEAPTHGTLPKPRKKHVQSCIPYPHLEARDDIKAWLAILERFIPANLRQDPTNEPDVADTVTSLDLALFVNRAQDASLDLLGYLGLVEGRWQTVVWMMKKLAEDGYRSIEATVTAERLASPQYPGGEQQPLKDLTETPMRLERAHSLRGQQDTLDTLTSAPDSIYYRRTMVMRALGQLWRSLGSIILSAADLGIDGQETIMPHVLEMIAYLHHTGFMPDSVYTYRPHKDKHTLQQPPTLHMLSSKILTALSDATWKAHEAAVKNSKDRANVKYFLGHEIPESRYKVQVTEIAPELWLELVLWSCLHGGWILDGTAILKQLAAKQGKDSWALISWREVIEAEQRKAQAPRRSWSLFSLYEDTFASTEDRARTRRTISAEVVIALVDGLVNQMRLGVGARGVDPDVLVASIKVLKGFLDANNLSLGSTAWDSIMARLLESGGFAPEKRPELLLRIFELAPGFGTEVGAANAAATVDTEVPYFFEPTTLPLSLLHRTMRAFMQNGDMEGALNTLTLLQRYTDDNKQKSVEQFFEFLRSSPQLRRDEPFTSRQPPVEYPAFDNKLPVPLLARLLDLATETKRYDLGRWLLFSDDLDGPLIGPELYSHRNIAASIVRFGTLAGENHLVLKIVNKVATFNEKYQQQRMPAEILMALLCCQIKLRQWDSVEGMQAYVQQTLTFRPRPIIISTFAAELLRTTSGPEDVKVQAQEAFSGLLFAWEMIILNNIRDELYCALAIMSTVDSEWKDYCSPFLSFSSRQAVTISTEDFNRILGGVLDGYDSSKGKDLVEEWCYKLPKTFEPYRAPGGLPTMPRYRVTKGDEYDDSPENIELVQDSGARLILQGRVKPNRQTILAIIRKAQEEVDLWRQRGEDLREVTRAEVRSTLKWASRLLYYLGFDYEDIVRDLGSLAELAELEAPAAPHDIGHVDGAERPDS